MFIDWQLLFVLTGIYVSVHFFLLFLVGAGVRHLRKRFQNEFGLPLSEDNLASLAPDESARWASIRSTEFEHTPYRWFEIIFACFHYPSIIVLSVILKKDTLGV